MVSGPLIESNPVHHSSSFFSSRETIRSCADEACIHICLKATGTGLSSVRWVKFPRSTTSIFRSTSFSAASMIAFLICAASSPAFLTASSLIALGLNGIPFFSAIWAASFSVRGSGSLLSNLNMMPIKATQLKAARTEYLVRKLRFMSFGLR